jgi:hypothetical protein
MNLKLLKSVVFETSTATHHDKRIINAVVKKLGYTAAHRIFEVYDIQPTDYTKWLDVIIGYAKDEGIKLTNKSTFFDVALAVLGNDPANIDHNLQEAIVNKLWIDYKSTNQQTKIDKLHKVAREEEQLSYAINRIRGKRPTEDEQFLSGAGMDEEEYHTDWGIDTDEDEDEDDQYDDEDEDEDEDEDDNPRLSNHSSRRAKEHDHISTSHTHKKSDKSRSSNHSIMRSEENEETAQFAKHSLVHYKKDGNNYSVAIEDGPGNTIGLLVNNRIKLVQIKDVESIKSEDEEYSGTTNKTSYLHDVLTGEKSKEHLNALQRQIEDDGANIFTNHHVKAPRNPHPTGSFAYKSWQKGFDSAAKDTWAPKKVEAVIKPKPKPKKK